MAYPDNRYPDDPEFPTIHDDLPIGPDLYTVISSYITDLSEALSVNIIDGNIFLDADKGIYWNDILQISLDGNGILFSGLDIQDTLFCNDATFTNLYSVGDLEFGTDAIASVTGVLSVGNVPLSTFGKISRTEQLMSKTAEPADPAENNAIIWLSDGTGYGDDNDLCIKITEGGSTNSYVLSDYTEPNYLGGARGIRIFSVSGTEYALVASYNDNALVIFDVSDPTNMIYISKLQGDGAPNYLYGAMGVDGYTIGGTEHALVASELDNQFVIVDISTPASPAFVSNYAANNARTVFGDTMIVEYAFVAGDWGIQIFDISTPATPVETFEYMQGEINQSIVYDVSGTPMLIITRSGQYAGSSALLGLWDVTDPTSIGDMVGSIESSDYAGMRGLDCITIGGTEYAIVCCSFSRKVLIVDISTPASPAVVATYNTTYQPYHVKTATIGGTEYAFITLHDGDSVIGLDISTPASPVAVDLLTDSALLQGAYGIDYAVLALTETIIVTAETSKAIVAIDVSTPASMAISDSMRDL